MHFGHDIAGKTHSSNTTDKEFLCTSTHPQLYVCPFLSNMYSFFFSILLLKQTEFKMFVNHSSAAEIGTTRASINRTGKTYAAKGVENHYNEYSEFHAREVEAHICASFMAMIEMEKISGKGTFNWVDVTF